MKNLTKNVYYLCFLETLNQLDARLADRRRYNFMLIFGFLRTTDVHGGWMFLSFMFQTVLGLHGFPSHRFMPQKLHFKVDHPKQK